MNISLPPPLKKLFLLSHSCSSKQETSSRTEDMRSISNSFTDVEIIS